MQSVCIVSTHQVTMAYCNCASWLQLSLSRTLVTLLQSQGVAVYLVSGGFHQLIEPIAKYLGIPKDNVFANRLLFNEEGTI